MRYRCRSCDGVYTDPQQDGARYIHVCPEERVQDVGPDPEVEGGRLVKLAPIEDRRDERPVPAGRDGKVPADAVGNPRIRSVGKGRTKLPDDDDGDVPAPV